MSGGAAAEVFLEGRLGCGSVGELFEVLRLFAAAAAAFSCDGLLGVAAFLRGDDQGPTTWLLPPVVYIYSGG